MGRYSFTPGVTPVAVQMQHIQLQNQQLVMCCHEMETEKAKMLHQLADLRDKWTNAAADNMRLQGELAALRKALEVRHLLFCACLCVCVCVCVCYLSVLMDRV
jgi:hypothetical protein